MTRPVLHIHVGYPKTGTSALQLFLMQNRDRLEASGLYLPRAGQRPDGPHHTLAGRLAGVAGRNRRGHVTALAEEIRGSGQPAALITSEYLLPLVRASLLGLSLRKLRGMGFDLRFHVFVRPQPDFLNSAYPELLRSTLTFRSFADFVAERRRAASRDYGVMVGRLHRYTDAPVTVHPYNAATRRAGVWWPLLEAAGVDPGERAAWTLPGEVNPTMGPIATFVTGQIVRRIEKRGLVRGFRNRQALRDRVRAATTRFPAEAAPFTGMDNALRDELWAENAAVNAAFAARYWGRPWDEVFAEERERNWKPNLYRPKKRTEEEDALAEAMMEAGWRACRRAVKAYEERSAARRFRDRLLDPLDRLLDLSLRLGLSRG